MSRATKAPRGGGVKEGARGGMARGAQLVTKRPVSVVVVCLGSPLSSLRRDMAISLVYKV